MEGEVSQMLFLLWSLKQTDINMQNAAIAYIRASVPNEKLARIAVLAETTDDQSTLIHCDCVYYRSNL